MMRSDRDGKQSGCKARATNKSQAITIANNKNKEQHGADKERFTSHRITTRYGTVFAWAKDTPEFVKGLSVDSQRHITDHTAKKHEATINQSKRDETNTTGGATQETDTSKGKRR
jgi:hypothetical protein